MFAYAMSNAALTSSASSGSGNSETFITTSSPKSTLSNFFVYSATAASPRAATASTMGATVPKMLVKSTRGLLRISTRACASSASSTYVRMDMFAGSATALLVTDSWVRPARLAAVRTLLTRRLLTLRALRSLQTTASAATQVTAFIPRPGRGDDVSTASTKTTTHAARGRSVSQREKTTRVLRPLRVAAVVS